MIPGVLTEGTCSRKRCGWWARSGRGPARSVNKLAPRSICIPALQDVLSSSPTSAYHRSSGRDRCHRASEKDGAPISASEAEDYRPRRSRVGDEPLRGLTELPATANDDSAAAKAFAREAIRSYTVSEAQPARDRLCALPVEPHSLALELHLPSEEILSLPQPHQAGREAQRADHPWSRRVLRRDAVPDCVRPPRLPRHELRRGPAGRPTPGIARGHRTRGTRENVDGQAAHYGMGCEPEPPIGRPCDLSGCAASTDPSASFCPPRLPPSTIWEEATCAR